MLDYDKKFMLKSLDNLTFDGSSIRGFSAQAESDLRLALDWSSLYYLPSDVFGPGKVLMFARSWSATAPRTTPTCARGSRPTPRSSSRRTALVFNAATEIEGFIFKGRDAERHYHETGKFEFVSIGGYYHSLPGDLLKTCSSIAPPRRSG
jgi:glutamine synthetase